MKPTAEQSDILARFATGSNLVVEAGAGTGKTTTLKLIAEAAAAAGRRGLYTAFNRKPVDDVRGKLGPNMSERTVHSLAFGAVGKRYKTRIDASRRMFDSENARILGMEPCYVTNVGAERIVLQPAQLAGKVMRAITTFCNSADPAPSAAHLAPSDGLDDAQNAIVAAHLAPYMAKAWADLGSTEGRLRFSHDVYLKLWQLADPALHFDFILFDEAQDASPVMTEIIRRQPCQVVAVGDSQQSIYGFRGAENALEMFGTDNRGMLSQSWRFGDAVATVANEVLAMIPASVLRLKGCPGMDSRIDLIDRPDAILCRTNAAAVAKVLAAQDEGLAVHLVGNSAKEVLRFAKAAIQLMEQGRTAHAELSCFTSWEQVVTYVEEDSHGGELRLMVKLVEDYTAEVIIEALEPGRMAREDSADLIVSTAHQAKGREWPTVALAADFPDGMDRKGNPIEVPDEELRLLYVAVTRARQVLDISRVALLGGDGGGGDEADVPVAEADAARTCKLATCGRTYQPGARGLADDTYCSGLCRSKAMGGYSDADAA